MSEKLSIRIGGDAGQGIESSGAGFCKALARAGLHVFRECAPYWRRYGNGWRSRPPRRSRPAYRLSCSTSEGRDRVPGQGRVLHYLYEQPKERAMNAKHLTIGIVGLTCGSASAVERSLAHVPGVRRAYVNPLTEMAYVEYDPERTDLDQMVAAVEHAGFRAGHPLQR